MRLCPSTRATVDLTSGPVVGPSSEPLIPSPCYVLLGRFCVLGFLDFTSVSSTIPTNTATWFQLKAIQMRNGNAKRPGRSVKYCSDENRFREKTE